MPITTAMCNSFKKELFEGVHSMALAGGDVFKVALFLSTATLNKDTTVYSASGEASGSGYAAGGQTMSSVNPALSGDTAIAGFQNVTWTSSSITARGCLIYNSSKANRAVSTHLFDADKTSSDGDFTLIMPTFDATGALLRLV